ncbi:MAG: DUF4105 domain-containing protein [Bacteroidales bacterium]|nr:DUF4105 domain-containing protein [Bacteroidales bacterium]
MILSLLVAVNICNANYQPPTVSVFTYEPGNEIYTIFGHTALRISIDSMGVDKVYNFGMFDFSTPFFYLKFAKGNLAYFLSVSDYKRFLTRSLMEHRKIYEQQLYFNKKEIVNLYHLLETCYYSDDRYYIYDFYYDNCVTRVRDYIIQVKPSVFTYDSSQFCCQTFRQLIKPYFEQNVWLDIGVNLLLGKQTDKTAKSYEFMFLPGQFKKIITASGIVMSEKVIQDTVLPVSSKIYNSYWFLCFVVMMLIALLFVKRVQKKIYVIYSVVIGGLGCFLLLISLISENPAYTSNYNVIWLLPAIFTFFIKKELYKNIYSLCYVTILILILVGWKWWPQQLSYSFIPWILLLCIMQINSIKKGYRLLNQLKRFRD